MIRDYGSVRRVLMTTDTVGGVWTYTVALAAALGRYDIDVAIASMGRLACDAQLAQVDSLPNVTLYESAFRLEWMDDPWVDVEQAGNWLLNLARRFEPDLVHLNNYAHGALPWTIPVVVVGHSCVLSWWRAVHGDEAPASYNAYRRAVSAGLAGADAVVAPSHSLLHSLEMDYGPFTNRYVIRNGHDPVGFRVGKKEPMIFCAGRLWDEAKNISCLVDAAPKLKWPVSVAGEIQHPDGWCVPLDNVQSFNHLTSDEMAECYARASIYALPARYEPFGLSVLEAALSGCALVLGDIPSLHEMWDGAALFVAPGDRRAWIDALNALAEDDQYRQSLAAQGLKRARRLTIAAQANRYVQLYGALCGERAVACG